MHFRYFTNFAILLHFLPFCDLRIQYTHILMYEYANYDHTVSTAVILYWKLSSEEHYDEIQKHCPSMFPFFLGQLLPGQYPPGQPALGQFTPKQFTTTRTIFPQIIPIHINSKFYGGKSCLSCKCHRWELPWEEGVIVQWELSGRSIWFWGWGGGGELWRGHRLGGNCYDENCPDSFHPHAFWK